MVKVWSIARVEVIRMLRDRSNIFFVFVFPLLLVVLIGAQFGGASDLRIGFVAPDDDQIADQLRASLDAVDGLATIEVADQDALRSEVARGIVSGGVVVPNRFGLDVEAAEPVDVAFIGRPDATASSVQQLVASAVADLAAPGTAARLVATELDVDAAQARVVALEVREELATVKVVATTLGTDELAQQFAGLGQFDLGASSQLFLFTFLTSLAGGAALIQTRQFGIARRMVATPTPMTSIVGGFVGGRFLVALTQAAYIVIATLLLFRVNWGNPLAAGAVVVLFCLVAASAGLVVGATFKNDSQAAGIGVGVGLGLAALGGSMAPIEVFPATMQTIARITPHAWANEAMAEIVRRDGGVTDVLPQLGVLGAFAVVLLTFGVWRLRTTLTH